MPSTPSGYVLPPEYFAVPGTTIRSTQHNAPLEDLAQGVNDCVARDGTRPMTGNLPMNGRKITGMADGSSSGDAVNFGQMSAATASATAAANAANNRVTSLISAITSAMNSSCPVGMVAWHNGVSGNIPSGWIAANGGILNRSDFPGLWSWASPNATSDSNWLSNVNNRAKYSAGNGSSTFRIPDLNGVQSGSRAGLFLRGSGGGSIQTTQGDAIRNITGSFSHAAWEKDGTGVFRQGSVRTGPGGTAPDNQATVTFDASRSVPTASENRPVSAIGVWIIRATPFSFAGI